MSTPILPLPDATPSVPDAGLGALSTERGNLPLDSVDVRADINGLVAGVEITQGFRNPFDVPVEAVYVFPLPDRAAVTRMRMEAADRVVEGTLKEREEARADYDAALAAGRRAAIAEEDRPDVFTMRVGNILPGERVTVRLTLHQPLPYEDDAATFRFPLVTAPRYIPGAPLPVEQAGDGVAPDTDLVPDASRISPPVLLPGFPSPVRLSLSVGIDPGGLSLEEIRSSLHAVAQESDDDGRTTVRLHPGERLDRDFILRLRYAHADDTAAALTLSPDDPDDPEGPGTFTLTVLPPAGQAPPRPRDVVLVLDHSGSMAGWSMVAARRAAARIVDTLTDRDRFAVIAFDHTMAAPPELGTELAQATDRNRFRAVEFLAGLEAEGGTEMLPPLQKATALLGGGEDSDRDRVLVLITDGQVGNEDHILARIDASLAGLRVHAVGIDQAVNAGFLGRLALAGRGRLELVESEDRLDEAMEHIHHRIGAPLLTGVSLEWAGVDVDPDSITPRRLGALFPGVPLTVSGRYRGAPADARVTVRAVTADGTAWRRDAAATVARSAVLAPIWARAHLRDLEDRYAVAGLPDLERRIVETSLRFNVLCRFTAFVAVDSRQVAEGGPTHRVIQPVERPAGWEQTATWDLPPMEKPRARRRAARPRTAPAAPPPPQSAPPPPYSPQSAPPPPPPGGAPTPPPPGSTSAPPPVPPVHGGQQPFFRRIGGFAGGPAAPGGGAIPDRDEVRRLIGRELEHLTAAADASAPERWRHLSDLRTRLRGLVDTARLAGLPAEPLLTLVQALEVTDDPAQQSRLEELWALTVQTLTSYLEDAPAQPAKRRPFWKRPS
ncbi:VIT domain-containing protein [Thermomonospora catenispora]|uniref:VIT domain-containing protein n=1 Tax=Thermomonospora catenispora TaxID=2493090 RepID=UPI00111F1DB6|nr:VIT domain-containing protein [Thermomonospora catenispora]TNY35268.1 VWA domain-containing protein [Thermomonospora catenispora]